MLEGKAKIQDTDMPLKMQSQATSCASYALDLFDVTDCKSIAAHIKRVCIRLQISLLLVLRFDQFLFIYFSVILQEFDERYGPGWQCVVGSNFGCFFTHKQGTFIYFSLEKLCFLVFKVAPFAQATKDLFSFRFLFWFVCVFVIRL